MKDVESVRRLADQVGDIDVLVNNAATFQFVADARAGYRLVRRGVRRGRAGAVFLTAAPRPPRTDAAIVFLASPWTSYLCGATVPVDGGRSAV